MKNNQKLFFLVLFAIQTSGCATNNVQFYEKITNETAQQVTSDAPVEIYIDYLGSIYPKTGIPSEFKHKVSGTNNSLKSALFEQKNSMCNYTVEGEAKVLCDNNVEWETAQAYIWQARAQEIINLWEASNREAEIVFLVHGFSVKAEDDDFNEIRSELKSFEATPNSVIYVDVNWDGFYSKIRLPAWNNAQYTAPLIGFNLRRLFNKMDDLSEGNELSQKIRVITHSSGAIVVGATFGNSFAAFPKRFLDYPTNADYKIFHENRSARTDDYRIPNVGDLRVANFAAATPSNTYAYTGQSLTAADENENYGWIAENTTIGFTVTNDDWGLRKGIFKPETFGASSMGNNKKYYCRFVKDEFERKGVESYIFDFDRDKSNGSKREHSILRYRKRVLQAE